MSASDTNVLYRPVGNEEFNRNIVGKIEVIAAFHDPATQTAPAQKEPSGGENGTDHLAQG